MTRDSPGSQRGGDGSTVAWLDATAGASLIRLSWVGTGVFVLVAMAGVLWTDSTGVLVAVVDLTLFAAGTIAFLWAYGIAVGRSRTDLMGMGGLFFLAGSAPARVRWALMIPLMLQVVVAIATAWARVYTALAFGTLVPMYGLGLAGLWGAKYGQFPPRGQAAEDGPPSAPSDPVGGG